MTIAFQEASKRSKRFTLFVRLVYLLAFIFIGTGIYINYLESLSGYDRGSNTDYNNIEINTSTHDIFLDVSDITSIDLKRIDELLNNSSYSATGIVKVTKDIDLLENLVENLANPEKHIVGGGKQRLEDILNFMLHKQYADVPGVTLNRDDLQEIFKRSKRYGDNLDRNLDKGQEITAYFSPEGNIVYLGFKKSLIEEIRYIRENNTAEGSRYYRDSIKRKTTPKKDVLDDQTLSANGGLYSFLVNKGVDNGTAQRINSVINWQLQAVGGVKSGAKVSILSTRQYIDDKLFNPSWSKIEAVKVVQGGKSYYAINYNRQWFDAKGFQETQPTFNRYPFVGAIPVITSGFNPNRRHPVTGIRTPHKGIDFGLKIHTPIYSPADGVVTRVTYQPNGAGKYLIIQHTKSISTVYMHLSEFKVGVGSKVKKGQLIAYSGNSGRTTGPHLHYEIHVDGVARNPKTVPLPTGSNAVNVNNNSRFIGISNEAQKLLK